MKPFMRMFMVNVHVNRVWNVASFDFLHVFIIRY